MKSITINNVLIQDNYNKDIFTILNSKDIYLNDIKCQTKI